MTERGTPAELTRFFDEIDDDIGMPDEVRATHPHPTLVELAAVAADMAAEAVVGGNKGLPSKIGEKNSAHSVRFSEGEDDLMSLQSHRDQKVLAKISAHFARLEGKKAHFSFYKATGGPPLANMWRYIKEIENG